MFYVSKSCDFIHKELIQNKNIKSFILYFTFTFIYFIFSFI